jgi:hypothetical protein
VARGGEEVGARVVEGEPARDVGGDAAQALHQAVEERGVRDLVEDARPRGEHAVLDAEVRPVAHHAVTGAVPAPDGAVVKAQRGEGRDAARAHARDGLLAGVAHEHHGETERVVAEELEHAALDPRVAEAHARPETAHRLGRGASVGRALEEGDARLLPEPLAEEQRRADGRGEERRGDELREVVERRELVGVDLEVELEAGVRRLEHDALVARLEGVDPAQRHREAAAAEPRERVVQREITGHARHRVEREVRARERREDADEERPRAERGARARDDAEHVVEVFLHAAKEITAERARVDVGLEVEARELRREARIGRALEQLLGHTRRAALGVDEEHLLLEADAPHAALDAAALEQLLEGAQVLEHRARERPRLGVVSGPPNDVLSHGSPRGHHAKQSGPRSRGAKFPVAADAPARSTRPARGRRARCERDRNTGRRCVRFAACPCRASRWKATAPSRTGRPWRSGR